MTHLCLARPEEGRTIPGDQFDCPECRLVLLDAFRDPAAPPEPSRAALAPAARMPHLIVEDSGRTVDLGSVKPAPCAPVWGALPDADGTGGIWRAVCNCGWRKTGPYSAGGRTRAERVAREWSQAHVAEQASPAHKTVADTGSFKFQDGGWYRASCTCGWERRGVWTSRQGEEWASGQAAALADAHRTHPEDDEEPEQ